MSIADKLTYLQTTKQLLKTEINKINNVLTDESTFRSYPQELFNGYLDILNNGTDTLWNNLEKVSASGEEATLENVETAPIKMVLNGNTSQDTTSGIQLFDISKVVTNWNDGKGVKNNNDGTLTVHPPTTSSSTSASSPNTLKAYCPTLQVGDVVYLNATTTGTSKYIYLLTSASVWAFKSARTITQNDLDSRVLWYASGNDTEATISDIIISKTNTTIWEKYTGGQPSPNPDYPQEVKVVKGENVVSVQGKNLFDTNYLTQEEGYNTYNEETGLWSTSTLANYGRSFFYNVVGNSAIRDITKLIKLKANTNYSIKFYDITDNTSGGGSGNTIQIFVVDSDGKSISLIDGSGTLVGRKLTAGTTTFRTIEECWLDIRRAGSSGNYTFSNVMLVEGTYTKNNFPDFVPYSKTDYPINLGDIELCKIRGYQDYLYKNNGKWYVHKEIEKTILNGSEEYVKYGGYTEKRPIIYTIINGDIVGYGDATKVPDLICSHFVAVSQQATWKAGDISRHKLYQKGIFFTLKAGETTDTFKTWLSSNNVSVYYPLATPTEEEITNTTLISQLEAISKAKSIKDKTYITQTNEELPFILDVEAIKEYSVE